MTLAKVKRFRIQASAIRETVEAIRSAGRNGYELFVLWSGKREDDIFIVSEVHIPDQVSYKTETGLCVRVDGPELHRINLWLYQAQQIIGVQIHSHSTDAYHSDIDDTYPIATLEGSLSIVMPWFGRDGWGARDIAAYRLGRDSWRELTIPLSDLIEVDYDGIS